MEEMYEVSEVYRTRNDLQAESGLCAGSQSDPADEDASGDGQKRTACLVSGRSPGALISITGRGVDRDYRYLNPYSIIVTEEDGLRLLDLEAPD